MKIRNIINFKAARTTFYIIFVSGLLSLTSVSIMILWNTAIKRIFDVPLIDFLEAAGIVSFVYVIYFGIKFGENSFNDKKTAQKQPEWHSADKLTPSIQPESLNKLAPEEKKEILDFVSRCCGMSSQSTRRSSFSHNVHHIDT